MAIGAEASVPRIRSASHTTMSPARASTPDLCERICSAMVLPLISGWLVCEWRHSPFAIRVSPHRLRRCARRLDAHTDATARDPRGADQVADRVHGRAAHVERTVDGRDERDAGGCLRLETHGVEHD